MKAGGMYREYGNGEEEREEICNEGGRFHYVRWLSSQAIVLRLQVHGRNT